MLELLTYDQISDIRAHLLAIYSQKELILHYHNLLDFRFAQGSIAFTQNLIVYTIKILILNPIEFSLYQRLAIINYNNQTEVITTPWNLTGSSIKLFANKCRQMYEKDFLCQQIHPAFLPPCPVERRQKTPCRGTRLPAVRLRRPCL